MGGSKPASIINRPSLEICGTFKEDTMFQRKCCLDEDLLGVNWSVIQGAIEDEGTEIIGTITISS